MPEKTRDMPKTHTEYVHATVEAYMKGNPPQPVEILGSKPHISIDNAKLAQEAEMLVDHLQDVDRLQAIDMVHKWLALTYRQGYCQAAIVEPNRIADWAVLRMLGWMGFGVVVAVFIMLLGW